MARPIVFLDFAGPDDRALASFYAAVFGWDSDADNKFEVPGVVVLGLFRDPAGNAMGLVEMDGNRPRVP